MRSYGQFCPVAQALEVVGERWTLLVMRELLSGSRRFNEIHRGVPLMSPTLLSRRLSHLERAGLVVRAAGAGGRQEYRVSEAGRELWPVIEQLGVWGQRWARREVTPEHLDPSLLLWDMRRGIDFARVPDRRLVIRFRFRGVSRGRRAWWLKLDRGEAEVCLSDPGGGTQLTVDADLRSMIMVWMGDLPMDRALRSGAVTLAGPTELTRAFPTWLRLNSLAGVPRPPRGRTAPAPG